MSVFDDVDGSPPQEHLAVAGRERKLSTISDSKAVIPLTASPGHCGWPEATSEMGRNICSGRDYRGPPLAALARQTTPPRP
jgi:hypothetical protein